MAKAFYELSERQQTALVERVLADVIFDFTEHAGLCSVTFGTAEEGGICGFDATISDLTFESIRSLVCNIQDAGDYISVDAGMDHVYCHA